MQIIYILLNNSVSKSSDFCTYCKKNNFLNNVPIFCKFNGLFSKFD